MKLHARARQTQATDAIHPTLWHRPDLVTGAVLFAFLALAAALRMPELAMIPRITDEADEVLLALQIARGMERPLTNEEVHIGALFNYLVAGAFLLLGPTLEAGRQVVAVFGALTVIPTYLLGRTIGGRAVGLLAALLMTASASHIAVNSHVAYSHSIMPLFSTTALWLLHRAVVTRSGPHLAASGLAFGLAFQTHPSIFVLAPGLALYLVYKARPLLGRWLLVGAVAAGLAAANLIVFNLGNRFASLTKAADRSSEYLRGSSLTLEGWAERLVVLLREVPTGLGGLVSESVRPGALLDPGVALYAVLAVAGLIVLCRRGEWLPLFALVSALLLISAFNARVAPVVVRGRHYALLLPLGYVLVAVTLVAVRDWLVRAAPRRRLPELAVVLLLVPLFVAPLLSLHRYYQEAHREQRTNALLLQAVEAVARNGRRSEVVYLDDRLERLDTLAGGELRRNLSLALELRGQRFERVDLVRNPPRLERGNSGSRRLLLRSEDVEAVASLYRLDPLPGEPGPSAPLRVFRASAHSSPTRSG